MYNGGLGYIAFPLVALLPIWFSSPVSFGFPIWCLTLGIHSVTSVPPCGNLPSAFHFKPVSKIPKSPAFLGRITSLGHSLEIPGCGLKPLRGSKESFKAEILQELPCTWGIFRIFELIRWPKGWKFRRFIPGLRFWANRGPRAFIGNVGTGLF